MIPLAFHGGTALRFLYGMPRYSEDLDFALERSEATYDLRRWLHAVESAFAAEDYTVAIRLRDDRVVHSAFVRFSALLHELDLSPHADEVLSVRIEVDTRPPSGANLAITVVRRHVVLRLQHHDRASLLAGKLHALLQRKHTKGRDLCDLMWYLSDPDWPDPNLILLNNALRQTGWGGQELDQGNWREVVRDRLESLDWARAIDDVRPFMESSSDVDLLGKDDIVRLLERA